MRANNQKATSVVYRPIQYLGSKLRSLPMLLEHTNHLFNKGDVVVDCFSGSSVVSQALATRGARVASVDSLLFCQHISSAMLGVHRKGGEQCSKWAQSLVEGFESLKVPGELGNLLSKETRLLEMGPSSDLVEFYRTIPQLWKQPSKSEWFASGAGNHGKSGFDFCPIVSSHYAGTYFGLKQSSFFDYARNQINSLRVSGYILEWTENALLTALYSTMSSAVCSAGKHFAQPLAANNSGNRDFKISRMHADRSIDCSRNFIEAANEIDSHAQSKDGRHLAIASPIEAALPSLSELRPRFFYADPPYTAQQYSRFYHVLEVVAKYEIPQLQILNGNVTSGIYNLNRYKSPFSSKRLANDAFENLISSAYNLKASLAISYSSSSERSTGNSRMISLPNLSSLCKKYYGSRFNVIKFQHVYRKFNSDGNSNMHRDDPELLIICEI